MGSGPESPLQATERWAGLARQPVRSVERARPRRTLLIAVLILGLATALSLLPRGSGAQASLALEPLVQKGDKLAGGGAEARFGTSTALSADGSTLLVGAPQADGSQGAAWIFQRSGAVWVAQGELTSPAAVKDPEVEECAEESTEEVGECAFGASVALSADGNTALVGEPSPGATAGSAWIFTRSGPGAPWVREAEPLRAGGGSHEGRFGRSVALSADGALALVGDPSGVNGRGAVWVFAHGAAWTKQSMIVDEEASPFAHLGRSVALSADASTVIAGGPGDAKGTGAAWTFTRSGASWTEHGKLTGASVSAEDHFGRAVALSGDGATALIGAQGVDNNTGAVWTFVRSGSTFQEVPEAVLHGAVEQDRFGASLALSSDGGEALVGAPHFDSGLGIVDVFERSASTWAERPALGGSRAVGKGYSGAAVALSGDGQVAAIGASRDDRRAGAAWVFSSVPASAIPPPTVTNVEPGHGPTGGGTSVTIQGSNFTKDSSHEPVVMFGSTPATSVVVRTAAEIQAVSPPGAKGVVHVTVSTARGTSGESQNDVFHYEGSGPRGAGSVPQTGSSTTGVSVLGSAGVLASSQTAGSACRVSLRSKRLVVELRARAAVRLLRTGTGSCRGTIKLRYRRRTSANHFKLLGIGSMHFAIAPGRSQVVRIKLNRLGRMLLLAGHGKLRASIAVLRTTPSPRLAKSASVRLSAKKAPRATPVGH